MAGPVGKRGRDWRLSDARQARIAAFLKQAGWGKAIRRPLAGDASGRRYERLRGETSRAILMDAPPGPDGAPLQERGRPYSAIAHLAEDVCPFVAVGEYLRGRGLGAPALLAHDLSEGLLLLEDLGDDLYGEAIKRGHARDGTDPETLYKAAIDVLVHLHQCPAPRNLPLPGAAAYSLPVYDHAALMVEAQLLTQWYVPEQSGRPLEKKEHDTFQDLWEKLFPFLETGSPTLVLRDFHSPNLVWMPSREGMLRVGLLDYQDAVLGTPAYDLVSLLQDARCDVPREREEAMRRYYIRERCKRDPSFDAERFLTACAVAGAQRNAKIMGIFIRLWKRDGKAAYLQHLPRVSGYMERNLCHPVLQELREWFDVHIPSWTKAPPWTGAEGQTGS